MMPLPILIVDDNAPFRHLMAAFLHKAGYATVEAQDGQQALEILERETVQGILLDLQMLPMGGFTFMEEYAELRHTAPVILITGDPSSDILTRASKMGFAGVLKKPVTEQRILQMLERVTSRSLPSIPEDEVFP
jgi:CheY-like chemotaxis protein